jgi:hypothetical protein
MKKGLKPGMFVKVSFLNAPHQPIYGEVANVTTNFLTILEYTKIPHLMTRLVEVPRLAVIVSEVDMPFNGKIGIIHFYAIQYGLSRQMTDVEMQGWRVCFKSIQNDALLEDVIANAYEFQIKQLAFKRLVEIDQNNVVLFSRIASNDSDERLRKMAQEHLESHT